MKRRYVGLLVAFLLILAMCTYASWQNYKRSFPVVQTAESQSTKLNHLWELSGTLRYDKTAEHSLPVPVSVVQRDVQVGDRVTAGQPLLQVDTQELHLQWLQCKIDEEALESRVRWSDSFTKDLLELQLTDLRKIIEVIENMVEAEGWVTADTDGIILDMQHAQKVPADSPLVTIGPDSEQKTIYFPLTETQAKYCEPETELVVKLVCNSKSTEVKMPVDRVIYSAENQGFLCVISTDLAVDMMDGQKTTATLAADSILYKHVIPTEAIVENNNRNASFYVLRQRETIMGTEYYTMKRTGYILEQNENYTALDAEVFEPVVISASEEIHDYGIVLLAPK